MPVNRLEDCACAILCFFDGTTTSATHGKFHKLNGSLFVTVVSFLWE